MYVYIQVDFGRLHQVEAVLTQGRDDSIVVQYVKAYRVLFSLDCITFQHVLGADGNVLVVIPRLYTVCTHQPNSHYSPVQNTSHRIVFTQNPQIQVTE